MSELLAPLVLETLDAAYGPGATVISWGATVERRWSWQTTIRVAGTPHPRMLIKVPRWEAVPTIDDAVTAGQQPSTVAEFEALRSIASAVTASRDPGLTAVDAVAYIPGLNAILMSHLDGQPLRLALRSATTRHRREILTRLGRLLGLVHGPAPSERHDVDPAAFAQGARSLIDRAERRGVRRLAEMMGELARSSVTLAGATEPVGFVHGDLNATNVLVDRAGRVAVIDPNPIANGPQLDDLAHLIEDVRESRSGLLTGGVIGRRSSEWARLLSEASGVEVEPMLRVRQALHVAERWIGLEEDLTGGARVALVPARVALRRRLRRILGAVPA
jgi:tRNA A-37 threonylcarbamoyl transferase component Bud32